MNRMTSVTFRDRKGAEPIAMLTAYDHVTATILDETGIDAILVGDSVGTTLLGYPDTTRVTMDEMVHHTAAVSRGVQRALVVADLPFLSMHLGSHHAVACAGRLVQEGGAQAVKVEGCSGVLESIRAILEAGIPVMGHLGLTPQSVHALGGYARRGREEAEAAAIRRDAQLLEEAGVFGLVLECVPAGLARELTETLNVPVIGIGCGTPCDGQVLVSNDILGWNAGPVPGFVRSYLNTRSLWAQAFQQYIHDVKAGTLTEEDR